MYPIRRGTGPELSVSGTTRQYDLCLFLFVPRRCTRKPLKEADLMHIHLEVEPPDTSTKAEPDPCWS